MLRLVSSRSALLHDLSRLTQSRAVSPALSRRMASTTSPSAAYHSKAEWLCVIPDVPNGLEKRLGVRGYVRKRTIDTLAAFQSHAVVVYGC